MRRRTFLATLPLAAAAPAPFSRVTAAVPSEPPPAAADIHAGDRIAGANFASRSTVWGSHGAAATAHPLATLTAIDILRAGGSAVDAAIAANAALGLLEPVSCGIGGDCFVMLWDPKVRKVLGLNGSGRSPRSLSLETQQARAKNGFIASYRRHVGLDARRRRRLVDAAPTPWPPEVGRPVRPGHRHGRTRRPRFPRPSPTISPRPIACFTRPGTGIEEIDNFKKVWAAGGRTPAEGEMFANPALAHTYRLIAEGGREGFYGGEVAAVIDAYFKRIGGWLSKADLAAHRSQWVEPVSTSYRGVDVWALPPNSQGIATLQALNILETFDMKALGFQSAASLHTQIEAKRLAFEDRARYYADPDFARIPIDWLVSKAYAAERAKLIRPDAILTPVHAGEAPSHGDTTYFCTADADGMMVSIIQSNYRGMGSGLSPDGLGFMFQDRGELFDLTPGRPNSYAPGKRPFQTIIPGFATRDGEPWMAFGVMGGDMQPQGQAQIIVDRVDYGLGLQEAGDCPRWHHEGSSEPTGEPQHGLGLLHLESGVPAETRQQLAALGWPLGRSDGSFGGYQAIERWPGRYAAASEMRKDGAALAW